MCELKLNSRSDPWREVNCVKYSGEEIMFRTDLLDQPSILDEYSRVSAQHKKKYSWSMMCSEVLENRKFIATYVQNRRSDGTYVIKSNFVCSLLLSEKLKK